MQQFTTTAGSRQVVSTSNDGVKWSSRLYVSNGETATLTAANHKSRKGAESWAKKVLGR